MSSRFMRKGCLVAVFSLAVFAIGSANAAKPITPSKPASVKQSLSVQQKNEMARAMRASPAARKAPPKTMAQAMATMKVAQGEMMFEMPEELYNFLGAQPDQHGRMRVSDIDPAAPSQVSLEVADEG